MTLFKFITRFTAINFFLLLTITQSWSQTLTPVELKGCYYQRFEINLDSTVSSIELNVCLNDQHQFSLQVSAEKLSRNYWGTYSIVDDTIHLTIDPYFQEFHVGMRYNKKIKNGLIKVSVRDTPISSYGILVTTLDKDSVSNPYYVTDFESQDSIYTQPIKALPGDKIQLLHQGYGSERTYSYTIPDKANDFYVIRNIDNTFTTSLIAWKTDIGLALTESQGNRADNRIDTLRYVSFDENMFQAKPQHYPMLKEYTYLPVSELIDPPADLYNYDAYTDTTTYPADDWYSNDTVRYVTDYKKALKQAQDSARYLVLYYHPSNCKDCGSNALKDAMQGLNNPYDYSNLPAAFNSRYILYMAPEKDSLRFRTLGAKEFPATVVLTPDEKLLYIAYGENFNITKSGYCGYDSDTFYQKLEIHNAFTFLPDKIKASGFDSTYINKYLKYVPLSGQYKNEVQYESIVTDIPPPAFVYEDSVVSPAYDAMVDVYSEDTNVDTLSYDSLAYTESPHYYALPLDDSYHSDFTLRADTTFAQAILDSLVAKYYIHIPADSAMAAQIIYIVYQFDDYYCPYYSSAFLTQNDTLFNPRISLRYLVQNYKTLSAYAYSSYAYSYSGYTISLYELISKRVNRFINYIETSPAEKQKALTFQRELINRLPPLKALEMPLYISNQIAWYDTLHNNDLEQPFVTDYLNEIGGNPDAAIATTDAIMKQLNCDNIPEAMNYDYSNYYYFLGGNYRYNTDELANTKYGYFKHAEALNHVAWHYYQHVADKDKLQQALTWSKSSLVLDPKNPYFLDTYAHLLYRSGKLKEAVKYQKKAVTELDNKKSNYQIDEIQAETIRADYQKMKTKTL
jgi:hypothetical protein